MNAPDRMARDPFAPVTRVELDAALNPMREELATLRGDLQLLRADVDVLRADVDKIRADMDKIRADMDKIRADMDKIRADMDKIRADVDRLRADVGHWREHGATKADVQAMGLRIVMWMAGLLAIVVAVVSWLVRPA